MTTATKSRLDRVERAVRKGRDWTARIVQPLARVISMNPNLIVHLTASQSYTQGGDEVWIGVPIEMGDELEHDKALCNIRDEDEVQLCRACRWDDELLVNMLHEVSHLTAESFEAIDDADLQRLVAEAVRLESKGDDDRAARIAKRVETAIESGDVKNYINAAGLVSKWFPHLLNVVEDGRVNSEMIGARPGTGKMFRSSHVVMLRDGIELPDGKRQEFDKVDPNFGVTMAAFLHISKQSELIRYLDPKVAEDGSDPVLMKLYERVQEADRVRQCFRLAFPILDRLRELGYFLDPEQDESEDQDQDQSDDQSDSDDQGDESNGGGQSEDESEDPSNGLPGEGDPGGQDEDGDPQPGDQGDEQEGDDGTPKEGNGQPQRPATPEEVAEQFANFGGHGDKGNDPTMTKEERQQKERQDKEDLKLLQRGIDHLEHFDDIASGVNGLKVFTFPDGPAWDNGKTFASYRERLSLPTGQMIAATGRLRRVFQDNRRHKTTRNQRRGKVTPKNLGRRAPFGDGRLFEKTVHPTKKDYFVLLGMDVSGSTFDRSGSAISEITINRIRQAVYAQAEMLSRIGVPFAIYAHSGYSERFAERHDPSGEGAVHIFEVKNGDAPWGPKEKDALEMIFSEAFNLDGHTMEFYRKRLAESKARHKVLLYYTDGEMPYENYEEELRLLRYNLELLRKTPNTTVLGVGVGTDSPTKHGLETVRLDTAADVGCVVAALERKLV